LKHYCLFHDHDSVYDVIAADVAISHHEFPLGYDPDVAPPWLD